MRPWMIRLSVSFFWVGMIVSMQALADPTPDITFIENKNQWPANVQFSATIPGGNMVLQRGGFSYRFIDQGKLQALHDRSHHKHSEANNPTQGGEELIQGHVVDVTFSGANPDAVPHPFGQSSAYFNYFIGNDPAQWASEAHAFQGVLYPSFYAGIDLKVYGLGQQVKYDLVVAPYADPSLISMVYEGTDALLLDKGNLYVKTSVADVIEQRPVAYQFIDGKRVEVKCEFYLEGNRLSFCFPQGYDPCYELVIDPLLIFSTYSGSTADNWGSTATPGERGTLYSAGVTSRNLGGFFPATPGAFQTSYGGAYDVGLLKYDSTGSTLLYASHLGGDLSESPHSLVMNASHELVVLGTTSSINFPTSATAFDRSFNGGTAVQNVVDFGRGTDIFLSRVSSDGKQLLASTYVGGSANDGQNPPFSPLTQNYGDELRGDVITDEFDNVYISSVTSSADFPVLNSIDNSYNGGETDAILMKLNKNLSAITWSTFLGGADADASHTLKFNKAGDIYIAGGTASTDFPVTTGSFQTTMAGFADGWIARVDHDGSAIKQATFTGTLGFDQIYFLDLNEDDEVYVYGQTTGAFLVTAGVFRNANSGQFVQKLNSSLSSVVFSTVFGSGRGIPDISPTAFLVNECNNIYMSGWGGAVNEDHWPTNFNGMPVTPDAYQRTTSGSDFYFMVLTDDASQFLYGTYLGGTQSKTHVDGGTSRFDKGGIVYHAVCSGCAFDNASGGPSSDFPTTPNAHSRTNNSQNCNNAAFKFDLSSLKARIQSNSVALDRPGLNVVCIPDSIVFQNFSTGGEIYEWDLGDGTKITKFDTSMVVHRYQNTGTYTIWLKAIDKGTCIGKDSTSTKVNVFIAKAKVQDDDALCFNASYTLTASGGAVYAWQSKDGAFTSGDATPTVSPKDTTIYYVTVTEATGCVKKDTVQLNVIPLIAPDFEIDRTAECFNRPVISVRNLTDSLWQNDRIFFDFGDGATSDGEQEQHEYEKDGMYNVKLVAVREFCVTEKVVPTAIFKLLIPNIITPGKADNTNDSFTIQYGDVPGLTPADYGFKTSVVIYNRWGKKVFGADDYQYDWEGEGLAAGVYYYEVTVSDHATCKSWVQVVK
ncbi:PKD domain-containing protein [Chryseolinea lacunae]|uniref:Gliding motility-associated C-terminal domain-containing protein n=1 Tax=Chryseolinea lacunae TaxID=2801331 RepID=A0ABS1KY46_9BACT|nr:PKD domain-containing protein [Chryseolinea lacunae]MBL0744374.1 gliding motility-associated C-terminal domain-containing protein [Chryseolinea lacunae]